MGLRTVAHPGQELLDLVQHRIDVTRVEEVIVAR
jgi:hypothetical protein